MTRGEGRLNDLADDGDVMDEPAGAQPRPRRRMRRIAATSGFALALVAGGLWLARAPIADNFLAGELAGRGVQGRYQITRIGPRTQRIDNLVIGDPRRPDLTARFIEIDLVWGLSGPRISRLQASGVRLSARMSGGQLDLGQFGRLFEGGGGPARLPDWIVALEDARAEITTEMGRIIIGLDGQGALRSGFVGKLNLAAPTLRAGDCATTALMAPLTLGTESERILIKGPVSSQDVLCAETGLRVAAPELDVNLRSDLGLTEVSGALTLRSDRAAQAGRALRQVTGLVTFSGSGEELRGSAAIAAESAAFDGLEAAGTRVGGNFALRPMRRDRALAWQGMATLDNARIARLIDLDRFEGSMAGTPAGPLASKLARAIERLGVANRIELGGQLNMLGARGNARIDRLALSAASGARIENWEGSVLRLDWPGGLRASGRIDMRGGGLPEGHFRFSMDDRGGLRGTARLAPYGDGTARLALAPVAFALDARGHAQIRTVVSLDGPLPDGAVTGLTMPIDAGIAPDGALRLAGDCAPLRWTRLRTAGLTLDPASLRVCGLADGRVEVGPIALAGRLGESALAFSAASARYSLATGRFDIAAPDLRIGAGESPVRMAAQRLTGAAASTGGFAGSIEQGAARIGTVPLDLMQIAGEWRFARARLDMAGALRVRDTQAERRFDPLGGRDVRLTLADGQIEARGMLAHPVRQVPIATVTIRHALGTGQGEALIALDGLRFGRALQPDDLTPFALGIVANVEGVVEGGGRIRWDGQQVRSDGRFRTSDMSFAAAFGPVTGFATDIGFVDLLGLRTGPGQVMTMASVNPGIDVRDGTIRYALRSGEQAVIEGGQWPFSGGTLELLPAILDLDARKPRHLTFRVVGLDAGAFINTLELDNISATGTFDGLLPMIFDAHGGRVAGGLLVARQQGNPPLVLSTTEGLTVPCDPTRQSGRLAYVGEVSNADLGAFGKLAFDALKNLRYRCLAIQLDGAIDGEFVTRLSINGINQGTEEARRSFLARPFLGLPFIFNVRIEAPFRGLLNTANGLADPGKLISGSLGNRFAPADEGESILAVQPPDSDKTIEGDR